MKKIFITGASGFIGGAIARKLARENWVLAMARSDASAKKIKENGGRPIVCGLDSVTAGTLKECDLVIHCAAHVKPWGRYKDFYEVNVDGTRRMLDAAKKAGVRRFIHMSTESVLFRGQNLQDIDETYPYPQKSSFSYSDTKKLAEILVREANVPDTFETISIRPRLVWGPGDETIMANLMHMVDSGKFRWINQGRALTSSTHIDNLVSAVILAMSKGKGGEVYFVTDWEVHTMRDFITMLCRSQGRNPGNKNVPAAVAKMVAAATESAWRLLRIKKKPPITRFSAAIMSCDCTIASRKAEQELGYMPLVSVADGMKALENRG